MQWNMCWESDLSQDSSTLKQQGRPAVDSYPLLAGILWIISLRVGR